MDIVHDHRELIGKHAIATSNYEISHLGERENAFILDTVYKSHRFRVVDSKACSGGTGGLWPVAADTRIATFVRKLPSRAGTFVDTTQCAQLVQGLSVSVGPLALIFHRAVPL